MQQPLDELRRMTNGRVDHKTFYEHLLARLVEASSAESGLVWSCSQSPYRLIAEHNVQANPNLRASIQHQKHTALLEAALKRNQPILIPPRAEAPDNLPVIALGPITRGDELELIELFLRADGKEEDFREWLLCLQEFCQVARELPSTPTTEVTPTFTARAFHPTPSQTTPAPNPASIAQPAFPTQPQYQTQAQAQPFVPSPGQQAFTPAHVAAVAAAATAATTHARTRSVDEVDHYVSQLHQGLETRETMSRIANETRRFFDADRVSVVQWRRGRARVQAISGQPSVNRRSSTVQLLTRLVNAVLPLGETFWYPGPEGQTLPGEIEHPLNDYLTASTVRSLIVVPVSDQAEATSEDPDAAKKPVKYVAGLVIEKFDAQWAREELAPTVQLIGRHAGSALRNSIQHRSLFLYPLWSAMGKSKLVLAARNARWATLILTSLLAIGLILTLVQVPFRVACNGMLLPEKRQNVFAATEGKVSQIFVDHGSTVAADQVVVKLEDEGLLRQKQQILGQIEPLKKKMTAMNQSLLERQSSTESQQRESDIELEQSSLQASLDSAQRQLEIIDSQIRMLDAKSPMSGQVLTWDVRQQLVGKPVRRGDPLLEVADVNGPWELELKLPDRRIGHVLRAHAKSDKPLAVTFVLAADPNISWQGTVKSIAKTTQQDAVDGQTIRVEVAFDPQKLDIKQARSGVLAKIDCGKASLGYVWLHDIFEFIQSKIFFRLW